MKAEQGFFLQIMADHLAGGKTAPRTGIDWTIMKEFAHAHQVEGIIYYQCQEFMPEEACAFFERRFNASLYYYMNRKPLMQNIREVLSANGIPYFIVKGLEVAKYYPVPGLRTMGDTDIIVHAQDRDRAAKILTDSGFVYDH